MKKFKGFTLVELIVVIAIIGVLAAILVPNMMGYISKSKLSSANTAAKNVQTALVTYKADKESMGTYSFVAQSTAWQVSSGASDEKAAVYTALSGNSNMGYAAWFEEEVNGENVIVAQWSDQGSNHAADGSGCIIGQYPNAQADYATYKATKVEFGAYNEWT